MAPTLDSGRCSGCGPHCPSAPQGAQPTAQLWCGCVTTTPCSPRCPTHGTTFLCSAAQVQLAAVGLSRTTGGCVALHEAPHHPTLQGPAPTEWPQQPQPLFPLPAPDTDKTRRRSKEVPTPPSLIAQFFYHGHEVTVQPAYNPSGCTSRTAGLWQSAGPSLPSGSAGRTRPGCWSS